MNHLEFYVDCLRQKLVDANGNDLNDLPPFRRGDDYAIRWRLVDVNRSASPYTVTPRAIADGSLFVFVGKARKDYTGTTLVYTPDSGFNDEAVWDQVNLSAGRAVCKANFRSSQLNTAIGEETSIDLEFDLQVIDPDGLVTTLLRIDCPVYNDVARGDEAVGDAAPTYYTQAEADARFALPTGVTIERENDDLWFLIDGIRTFKVSKLT